VKAPSLLLDVSLLRDNPGFRTVLVARTLSVLSLGLLSVAVPVQVQELTGSPLQVGAAAALGGAAAFAGLLLGGVLADRLDRRRLILFARLVCGLGLVALAANGLAPSPGLWVIYLLAVWDGFFGAVGMTALMAATPALVGRDNLAAAGGLNMLSVRLGGIVSPAAGGLLIAWGGVGWTYAVAAGGVMLTLFPLARLPAMVPQEAGRASPLRALAAGIGHLLDNRLVGAVVMVGSLVSLAGGVRVLFPAQAEALGGQGPAAVGLMFSAVSLGAVAGALTSGWTARLDRPGAALLLSAAGAFAALGLAASGGGLTMFLAGLAAYGYLGALASLLQFTLVQRHTPDHLLGRVNSLWTAQTICGDSLGALGLGGLGRVLGAPAGLAVFAAAALAAGGAMAAAFGSLRQAAPLRVEG
jgi:ENTS family enterobactin (siderophore) exporter